MNEHAAFDFGICGYRGRRRGTARPRTDQRHHGNAGSGHGNRASTAHALLDSARLLDGALQAGGTRLDQLSVDVRGGDVRSGAATGADTRAPASHSDGGGQRPPTRDPRAQDTSRAFQPAPPPRHAQTSAHDRFA